MQFSACSMLMFYWGQEAGGGAFTFRLHIIYVRFLKRHGICVLHHIVLRSRNHCCSVNLTRHVYVFFWVIPRCLNFICRRFGTLCLSKCSVTSAYKIQAPRNYQEENIQHTEQGEILKLKRHSCVLFSYMSVLHKNALMANLCRRQQ